MKFEYTESDIAECGLCTKANVVKAGQRGKFDPKDLGSVIEFIVLTRIKELGVIGWIDSLPKDGIPKGVQKGCGGIGDPTVDYSESQEFE